MKLQPIIDWFVRGKRRPQLNINLSADGSVTIRQGRHHVHLSHRDALLLLQLKRMQA